MSQSCRNSGEASFPVEKRQQATALQVSYLQYLTGVLKLASALSLGSLKLYSFLLPRFEICDNL
jgi:hypothetical protein